jgi:hypothetical protein
MPAAVTPRRSCEEAARFSGHLVRFVRRAYNGIAQTFTARDPDKITGLTSVMIRASHGIAHRLSL